MTPAALLSLVAVIGPPTAGKSTLTAALATGCDLELFRLREFAARGQRDTAHLDRFATRDSLGWFSDAAVNELLRAAFLRSPARHGMVLLEGFPGSAPQTHLLAATSRLAGAAVTVVELDVPDPVVFLRAATRRVCRRCDPGQGQDPRQPASAHAAHPNRCRRCMGLLDRRRTDAPAALTARLQRYRDRLPGIRAAASALDMPYTIVDAAATPNAVTATVLHTLQAIVPGGVLCPAEGVPL